MRMHGDASPSRRRRLTAASSTLASAPPWKQEESTDPSRLATSTLLLSISVRRSSYVFW